MADEVMKYSTAKAVATRKNNEIKKSLPLFADQVEEVTPEDIIVRKEKYLAWSKQRRQEQLEQEVIEAAKLRQELRELIDDDTEFSLLDAQVVERQDRFGGIATSYRCMVKNMKKRLEPCSQLALRLLLFLEHSNQHNKHKDYSAYELGKLFNTEPKLISKELENLYDCALADTPNGIQTCSLTGKSCCHWRSTY